MKKFVDVARWLARKEPVNRAGRRVLETALRAGRRAERLGFRWRVAGPLTVEVEGFRFQMIGRCDDICLDALWLGHPWATGELRLFATLAQRARTVLDIGANTGVFTLLAARANGNARVVAFEPHPGNFDRLCANVQLNGLRRDVELVPAAAGESGGTVSLTAPADGRLSDVASVVGDFARAHYGIEYRAIAVEQTTVDAAAERLKLAGIDLIKLDVEYHEVAALTGARATLERWSPAVLAEVSNYDVFAGEKPELAGRLRPDNALRVEEIMGERGYHFYAVGDRGLLRVESLRGLPERSSNYLFSRALLDEAYTPYSDVKALEQLLPAREQR
jgi:FkbM family methyltransferase